MEVQPKQPSAKGPAEWFTGDVWIDAIAKGEEPSRIRVSAVRFTPGARSAWHSHALGQTLYVTDGAGLAQSRGGDIVSIRSGDVERRRDAPVLIAADLAGVGGYFSASSHRDHAASLPSPWSAPRGAWPGVAGRQLCLQVEQRRSS